VCLIASGVFSEFVVNSPDFSLSLSLSLSPCNLYVFMGMSTSDGEISHTKLNSAKNILLSRLFFPIVDSRGMRN